jgi:nucleotidyltransferase/DNA polymerase involved in DNA repair
LIAAADPRGLRAALGDRAAALIALAGGSDDRPVEAELAAKSYGEENTFERDVSDRETVTQALTSQTAGATLQSR